MNHKVRFIFIFLSLFFFFSQSSFATNFFVSPTGLSSNNGTQQSPWDLQTALIKTDTVHPGDTIWLRNGTYTYDQPVRIRLKGTNSQPVIVRTYPKERAIISKALRIDPPSAYLWLWGLEVTNFQEERETTVAERPAGITIIGNEGIKVINSIIHNTGHSSFGFWANAIDSELYGNIGWGNGLADISQTPPWNRGDGVYTQNETGTKKITDNIFFRNYTYGIKLYGQSRPTKNYEIMGNILFDPSDFNIITQTDLSLQNVLIKDNFLYSDYRNLYLGGNGNNSHITLDHNYVVSSQGDPILITNRITSDLSVINNTFFHLGTMIFVTRSPSTNPSNFTFSNNKYFAGNVRPDYRSFAFSTAWNLPDTDKISFADWQSNFGYDQNSTYQTSKPTTNLVAIRPNKYEAGRAHIVVYNWENKTEELVDVSEILKPGDIYELYDAQNIFNVIQSETYTGGSITIPLNLTAVSAITGNVTHFDNVHTPTVFNAFVLSVPNRSLEYPNGNPNASLTVETCNRQQFHSDVKNKLRNYTDTNMLNLTREIFQNQKLCP